MGIVINSDIFVDALRGAVGAKEVLKFLASQKEVFYSEISVAELMSSKACDDKKIKESTIKIFSVFRGIPVDEKIVQQAAYFRRRYGLLLPDAIIAASAFQYRSDLLTGNTKDFSKIRELKVKSPY